MMKKTKITGAVLAIALGFTMVGCGGGNGNDFYATKADPYVASDLGAVICYDNLNLGYVNKSDTVYQLELTDSKKVDHVSVSAIDANGNALDASAVATWDAGNNTLTAVGKGLVTLSVCDAKENVLATVNVQCAPAYPEDPGIQYKMTAQDYYNSTSKLNGGLHDPSLIEVTEADGSSTYYIFSTGWNNGNDIHKSKDLLHWEYANKPAITKSELTKINEWLGGGASASWWAPDIVHAPDGGYWLYTCIVDGTDGKVFQTIDGGKQAYNMACIVLFHSDKIDGRYTYEGVLMQSCIPYSGADEDVNAIDPQIIWTPEGRMYMAYGSFGTGNYILELDTETGLRKDGFYKNDTWLTPKQVRDERDNIVNLFQTYENEDGEQIGWSSAYYGTAISRKNMEAPVIARHDNVQTYDDNGNPVGEAKTYYYSMHSFDPLDSGYAMWGGRSENVEGIYYSTTGDIIQNLGARKTGNKYMGSFVWEDNDYTVNYDPILTGHNDLFTNKVGQNFAAYITRTNTYKDLGVADGTVFLTQVHQYSLNSKGNICINANRYGGEVERAVTKDEFLSFAKDNQFKLIVLGQSGASISKSSYVTLNADGTLSGSGYAGTWSMYGDNFIKISVTESPTGAVDTYYGVVTCCWLDDQNCVGMTFSAMGQKTGKACFGNSVVK